MRPRVRPGAESVSAAGDEESATLQSPDASPCRRRSRSNGTSVSTGSAGGSGSTVPAFLVKTYEILEHPDFQDYVSWDEAGETVVIKKLPEFSGIVLPKYFKHNNFQSFVRQLNMYNFHKVRQGSDCREFKHPLFRRGQRHLLQQIKRKASSGGSAHSPRVPKTEPAAAAVATAAATASHLDSVQQQVSQLTVVQQRMESGLSLLSERVAALEQLVHVLSSGAAESRKRPLRNGSTPMQQKRYRFLPSQLDGLAPNDGALYDGMVADSGQDGIMPAEAGAHGYSRLVFVKRASHPPVPGHFAGASPVPAMSPLYQQQSRPLPYDPSAHQVQTQPPPMQWVDGLQLHDGLPRSLPAFTSGTGYAAPRYADASVHASSVPGHGARTVAPARSVPVPSPASSTAMPQGLQHLASAVALGLNHDATLPGGNGAVDGTDAHLTARALHHAAAAPAPSAGGAAGSACRTRTSEASPTRATRHAPGPAQPHLNGRQHSNEGVLDRSVAVLLRATEAAGVD